MKNLDILVRYKIIDPDLIRRIANIRNLEREDVKKMMSCNVMTPVQLSVIANKDVRTINNMVRDNRADSTKGLTEAYPFPIDKRSGPLFIFVDKKCLDYIKQCLKLTHLYL